MIPRLFKTALAEYYEAQWDGKNTSGWHPLGDRILIKPDAVASKRASGIELPEDIADRMTMAAEAGIVVALGDGAFKWNSDRITPFEGKKPQPGDRVSVNRYAGAMLMGKDGVKYRVFDSTEIGAIEERQDNG